MSELNRTFQEEVLKHILNNVAIANIGDGAGLPAGTAGDLYIALHTADPTETGAQDNFEATYTNYTRIAIDRDGSAWTISTAVSPSTAKNAAAITFAQSGGTQNIVTHFSVGKESTGATVILYSSALTASKTIDSGDTPEFAIDALILTLD